MSLIEALPPWDLKGVGWTFLIKQPFSKTPVPLPPGSYSPFEQNTTADLSKNFHGGVGVVMIIRYSESPVGPYDELIYIPGLFSREECGDIKYYYSITRIYVSSESSILNGRRNWGIPKHLAKFDFTPTKPSSTNSSINVSISRPSSSTPFFKGLLSTSIWLPSFPVYTIIFANSVSIHVLNIPAQTLYQTRLPSALLPSSSSLENDEIDQNGKAINELTEIQKESIKDEVAENLVSSVCNYLVNLNASGTGRISYLSQIKEKGGVKGKEESKTFGNGIDFPEFKVHLGMGVKMKFDMRFLEPEVAGFK